MQSGNYYRLEEDDLTSLDNIPEIFDGYLEIDDGALVCYKKPIDASPPVKFTLKAETCALVLYIDDDNEESVVLLYDDGIDSYESELVTT